MVNKPILYVKQGCPWCVDALDYFARKGIEMEVVDGRTDPSRMNELLEISGQSKTPTLKPVSYTHLTLPTLCSV